MTSETRYKYQKRIRQLEKEVESLQPYRSVAIDIFRVSCNNAAEGKGVNSGWLAKQFERVFK